MTSITTYDGAQGIGGNKILVEEKGKGVFLDFGKNFGKYGVYYEEFLKNRDSRGIHDLVHLDLIPKLNIYRSDLIPSDLRMSAYPSPEIAAVLVSHAHIDHSGNIGLLDLNIPIVASPLSLAILKGMQDSGVSAAETDAYYASPKTPIDESGLLLESDKKIPYTCRNSICTACPGDALAEFLSHRPGEGGKSAKKYQPGNCTLLDNAALPFRVTPYEVDHSIFGATAYILQGDEAIAYTGDLRIHGKLGDKTRDFVHHAKDASVLITEGTRAGRHTGPEGEGEGAAATSERQVYETCRAASDDVKGLVIADFSPRNFERLETFEKIAQETGRTLVVTAKDLYLLNALQCADGVCRHQRVGIYGELVNMSRRKWETEVVMDRAYEQYVSHKELRLNPDGYIVCFSFFDMKHLLDIKPEGGVYIYSSCEAFDEEMEIDFRRLWQWIRRFGMETRGFSLDEKHKPVFDSRYHASGHASREDLAWIIDQVDPDILIPVHTTSHQWFRDNFEGVRVMKDGERLEL
ncbi:MAG TPA: ribonuclease J [Methanolinea sp.]|nr:ribonuclease J [Methanolinea sp.]HQK56090.1 ribonuclease J [Methanolinea sp.]